MANSYRYIEKPDFRVVRDASSSIQPKKGRPLLQQTAGTDEEIKKIRSKGTGSVNDSMTNPGGDAGSKKHGSLQATSQVNLLYNNDTQPSDPYDN